MIAIRSHPIEWPTCQANHSGLLRRLRLSVIMWVVHLTVIRDERLEYFPQQKYGMSFMSTEMRRGPNASAFDLIGILRHSQGFDDSCDSITRHMPTIHHLRWSRPRTCRRQTPFGTLCFMYPRVAPSRRLFAELPSGPVPNCPLGEDAASGLKEQL